MSQRDQFDKALHQERASELKAEVRTLEAAQIRAKARNAALRQNLNNLMDQDDTGSKRLAE